MDERTERIETIRDSAGWIAPNDGSLKRIRELRFQRPGFDRTVWRTMCEMGWLTMRLPEEQNGAAMGMVEFCALLEELGKALVPEPIVGAAAIVGLIPASELSGVLDGSSIVLPAWQEHLNTLEEVPDTRLHDGYVTGQKVFVPMAAGADAFLVTVREGLALVHANAPGVRLTCETTQDGGHWGTLELDHAPAQLVEGSLALARDEAVLATAAYLLGVMDRAFAITLEYLRGREQFGQPLAKFQVLQHRAVDLLLQISLTRASVRSAAQALDDDASGPARQAAVSRAKARASEASLFVTRECIQLHGAIGFTDECDIGLYLRKAMVAANYLGSASVHRLRFLDLTESGTDE